MPASTSVQMRGERSRPRSGLVIGRLVHYTVMKIGALVRKIATMGRAAGEMC